MGNQKEPKIVVIGGGTGTPNLLRGLKNFTSKITAVVTMMDSGGSSGKLRDEFGHLPPGDTRRALVALAPDDKSSLLLRELFNYRFNKGDGLEGHSFGNLFLTALTEITGSSDQALIEAGKLLGIKGSVLPVTLGKSSLVARLVDGTQIIGESDIDIRKKEAGDAKIDYVYLDPVAYAFKPALSALEEADLIVLGPGDLYTSVVPNLLVEGVVEAINSSKAKKVYICNLMTKHFETDGFKASNFVKEIKNYLDGGEIDFFLVNKNGFEEKILKRYEIEKAYPVQVDLEECQKIAKKVIVDDFTAHGYLIRHDEKKTAKTVVGLID